MEYEGARAYDVLLAKVLTLDDSDCPRKREPNFQLCHCRLQSLSNPSDVVDKKRIGDVPLQLTQPLSWYSLRPLTYLRPPLRARD